jgi:hypothetical protein
MTTGDIIPVLHQMRSKDTSQRHQKRYDKRFERAVYHPMGDKTEIVILKCGILAHYVYPNGEAQDGWYEKIEPFPQEEFTKLTNNYRKAFSISVKNSDFFDYMTSILEKYKGHYTYKEGGIPKCEILEKIPTLKNLI